MDLVTLHYEKILDMISFLLLSKEAHSNIILMLLSNNEQRKGWLILKNDHKSIGFLFSQNILLNVWVIEKGNKFNCEKKLNKPKVQKFF